MSPAPRAVAAQAEALFIGSEAEQLFACYHPASGVARDMGFVLCAPLGQEYIQFHRSLRLLAILLAQDGFPTLRFDFRGCGDSAGDQDDWSVDNWTTDVDRALNELQRQSGVRRLGLIGLRLGATLALKTAVSREDVGAVVAWDAVLDGSAYLAEGRAQHEAMLTTAHVRPDMDPKRSDREEVLGFPMPATLVNDLGSVSLTSLERRPAPQALVVESYSAFPQAALEEHLQQLGATVTLQRHANPHLWQWTEDFAKVHIPRKILDSIRAWARELPS